MTGFARHTTETADGDLALELRAVNHRYLDIQLRLPEELRAAEPELRSAISAAVGRGKLECNIFLKRARDARQRTVLNREMLDTVLGLIKEVRAVDTNIDRVSPIDVLRWPDVLEEPPVEQSALTSDVQTLLDSALTEFNAMRAREGERMASVIQDRVVAIDKIADSVAERRVEVVTAMRERITEKVQTLAAEVDSARLATEVAILAQKLDVDEEIDRLKSHLVEVTSVLASDEPMGRRLDFLMQELNREANTLASKAADAVTTNASVDLKVLIEQMREQIQNIE